MKIIFKISSILIVAFAFTGCGRTEHKVDLKNDILGDAGSDPKCQRGKCEAIDYALVNESGASIETATAKGKVGEEVQWTVKIKTSDNAKRIKIAVAQAPLWMKKKQGAEPGSIVISGTPTEFVSKSTIVILARDIARCAMMESVAKDCMSPDKAFEKYDRKVNLVYSIDDGKDNGGGNSSNNSNNNSNNNVAPNPAPAPTPPPSNNCDKNSGILGSIAGNIPFVGGLFNKGSGC